MQTISVPTEVPKSILGKLPMSARFMMKHVARARTGRLLVTFPDGQSYEIDRDRTGPQADVTIHDWKFIRRSISRGDIGVAEAYMAGEWTSSDTTSFLRFFVANNEVMEAGLRRNRLILALHNLRHWMNRNTRSGSRRNISAHYDLGNDFYAKWLDSSMTYSSALFETGANDLASAQHAKYRALAESTDIRADHHVLEIGCGFGGFAEYVASQVGARVTALTISRAQYDFARERMARAGLTDRVEVIMRDYRDETGKYDRIASIEMFEAVGERYWPVFFQKMNECLKEDGRAGLQIITIQDRFFDAYRQAPDFIQRYIFPGGMLPPPAALRDLGQKFGLSLTGERIFGQDYARTLAEWRERFWAAWPQIKPMGFDERFKRLWEMYLYFCEAGFREEFIDVRQMIYAKAR